MSHALDHSMPHAGDILGGRYILRERIGAGGMGRVFRARDEVLARDVAIKIFFADASDEPEPLRRMSEARALAALDHPSLVTLYDARLTGDDHVYLVMELVNGPSLQRRIEEGPVSPAEVAGIIADLAGALAVVHDAGIVHRDVKPSNVLLRPVRGGARAVEAVLADFGVARLIGATRLTTPGTVIGTAAYLAPEQVRAEPPRAASDVYALGLLAIEALTRLHPFGGGTLQETLLARLARQPDIPGTYGGEWQSLLTSMTAFDPDDRPSAADVVARVQALAHEAAATAIGAPAAAASWMLPTAVMSPPPGASAGSDDPRAAAGDSTAPVAAGASVGVGAGSSLVSAARPRRSFRRRWVWAGAAAGAALVVGGHVMAFSLGAVPDAVTDRVSTPAPSSTPAPLVAENDSSSVESVSSTDAETPPPSPEPVAPQPVQPAPAQPIVQVPGGGSMQPGQGSPDSNGSTAVEPAPDTTPPGGGAVAPTPSASPSPESTPDGSAPGAGGAGKGNGNGNGNGKGSNNGKGPGPGHVADAPTS